MKTLIIIFITLLCFTKGNAQWYKVDSNTTENIYDIFFVDKNIGYCIAGDGILKSTDGGDSWNKVYTNNIRTFTYIVAFENTVIAFAFEEAKGISYKYTSVDNGDTWENETINYIPKFAQLSNNNIFYTSVLEPTTLKKLSNGIVTTILGSDKAYVYGVNKNEIVCVNYLGSTIYKSTDSGLTWETLPSFPPNVGNNQLTGAKIKSFNDAIIFASTYPNDINFSYDNGKNWTQNLSAGDGPWRTTIVDNYTLYGATALVYISVI